MKVITLYQPWATLIAIGAKRIETRSWSTKYRGPLAIHAGKNRDYISMDRLLYICGDEPFYSVLMKAGQIWHLGSFPLGAIVAICDLIDCRKIDRYDWVVRRGWQIDKHFWQASEQERAFGDYTPGRYMWFLANVKMLPDPIITTGAMSLWDWDRGSK